MRSGCRRSIPRPTATGAMTFRITTASIPITARSPISSKLIETAHGLRPQGDDRRSAGAYLRRTSLVPRKPEAASAKSDWYVWAPPKDDGTAPNNWLSAFGGPAWSYQPARRQHYHHKFLRQQPKLNWRNADARKAALDVLDTWLRRGVDGFRLDVANAYLHDAALTDNPPVAEALRTARNWAHAPNLQSHLHDSNLPDNITVLDEIRRVVERYRGSLRHGRIFRRAGALRRLCGTRRRVFIRVTASRCLKPANSAPNSSASTTPCWRAIRSTGRPSRFPITT